MPPPRTGASIPPAPASGPLKAGEALNLDLFIPYRLSVLTNIVSRSVARIYARRFGLTIPEWRVMAALGLAETRGEPLSANAVAARTAMDKVQVSRAVARMTQAGLLLKSTDSEDRRRSELRLSDAGHAMYREIVPAAQAYEANLLDSLSTDEVVTLERLLTRLTLTARGLEKAADDEETGE